MIKINRKINNKWKLENTNPKTNNENKWKKTQI